MDYSSDWLLTLARQYRKKKKQEPLFISDWDAINPLAMYPYKLIQSSLAFQAKDSLKYIFSDELSDLKKQILHSLERGRCNIEKENIAVTVSGTASLFLSLSALYKLGVRNFLVFTPTYYTIPDTLKDLGANIYYYHLYDYLDFKVDIIDVQKAIEANSIDAIIFSDPIYSAGIEINDATYILLAETCKSKEIWLLCDYSLGGMEWSNRDNLLLNSFKLGLLRQAGKFIFIESLTKRLLINGIKTSLIFCSSRLSSDIEDLASQVYGGFCISQIELIQNLYQKENAAELLSIIQHNKKVIKDNFELLQAFLMDTPYKLYNANSGYFTMIVHKEHNICNVFPQSIIRTFLFKHGVLAFPSFHFSFDQKNKFGFRINLLSDISDMLFSLDKCIREDTKLFHQ
ncbi:aminotransferase class I/II-fold pyridoxal phosphate-dependent enzyme [Ferruginibacter sp. HRS2-29]|nr:aminotransferase class I/II-fold pyridoxal phosphate-dependent enzyme [Ferruginibacter sp. HRS2-29]MCP9751490.1 aminotransferase class I/II-fold pyridoxal phosphate-dependent enzyme [Ferruginibacter sp. HRS2-29]MCP9751506.1 aminotransferase class I/II-fold pyridoxal phosphate-dependent enzyme [Ferruginibacter sp. HRS2-29]